MGTAIPEFQISLNQLNVPRLSNKLSNKTLTEIAEALHKMFSIEQVSEETKISLDRYNYVASIVIAIETLNLKGGEAHFLKTYHDLPDKKTYNDLYPNHTLLATQKEKHKISRVEKILSEIYNMRKDITTTQDIRNKKRMGKLLKLLERFSKEIFGRKTNAILASIEGYRDYIQSIKNKGI